MAASLVAALVRRSVVSPSSSNCSSIIGSSSLLFCKSPYGYVHLVYLSTTKSPSSSAATREDFYISKYNFSPQIASKIVSASARMRNPQNADLFLSFLQQSGFSIAHLEKIVTHYPQFLSKSPERSVEPKLKIFQDLGFSADEATKLIARDFTILQSQPERIIHSLSVYRRLLGSNDKVFNLMKKFGTLLFTDPEKTILPNIELLKSCGIQSTQINSLICTIPSFFMKSPENIRRCVRKADEMGVKRTSKLFIYAACSICTMSDVSLNLKLKSFQDVGFSQDDILRMFRSYPGVIAVSTRKIKEVIEVLLETGKYDMSCILKNPRSLTFSVEKRYKPRLQVLKELERKGLISKWPFLSTLCRITDKGFFEKFVAPNINEVGKYFIAMTAQSGKLATAQPVYKLN